MAAIPAVHDPMKPHCPVCLQCPPLWSLTETLAPHAGRQWLGRSRRPPGGYRGTVLKKIETVEVTVSAHRDDSYRSVERCARQQWADVLAERGHQWSDAGLQLIDSQPDTDVVGHLVYMFEGTMIEYVARVSG